VSISASRAEQYIDWLFYMEAKNSGAGIRTSEGAQLLGFVGENPSFDEVVCFSNNLRPDGSYFLRPRSDQGTHYCYVLHCHASVSVLQAANDLDFTRRLHQEGLAAAVEAMKVLDGRCQVRFRKDGELILRDASPVWIAFTGTMNRKGEPCLHWHVYTARTGVTPDGLSRSVESPRRTFFKPQKEIDRCFQEGLVMRLTEKLDIPAKLVGGTCTVPAVPPELMAGMCTRRHDAIEHLTRRGKELTPENIRRALIATRPEKVMPRTLAEQVEGWSEQAKAIVPDFSVERLREEQRQQQQRQQYQQLSGGLKM
jgi:hypothetical protein